MTEEPTKPAEASLLDDPATADLAAKVRQAWTEFGDALTTALPDLPAGAGLQLMLDPTAAGLADAVYEVSLSAGDDATVTAYAVSNAMLPPEYRLPKAVVGELVELGWTPPALEAEDRFSLTLPVAQASRIAAIVIRTFRDAYGSPHPAFLRYRAITAETAPPPTPEVGPASTGAPAGAETPAGTEAPAAPNPPAQPATPIAVPMPSLGAARPLPGVDADEDLPAAVDLSALPLKDKVAAVIAALLHTSPENLPVDRDGDIGIRSGSAMVFVRVRDNPPMIDVFSPVLTEVEANERLYVRLSELAHRMPIGRLYYINHTVWASVPVFGRDFQPTHLMLAVQVMTGLADELDDRLHGEFGGRRFWVDADRAGVDADTEHTGFYL